MAPWTETKKENAKGTPARQTEGQFPSVQGKQLMSPLIPKKPSFGRNLTD